MPVLTTSPGLTVRLSAPPVPFPTDGTSISLAMLDPWMIEDGLWRLGQDRFHGAACGRSSLDTAGKGSGARDFSKAASAGHWLGAFLARR